MLDKTQSKIDELQKLIEQLENIMQWALYEGDDVSVYTNQISKLETKLWRLETGIVN
tara:strand:- start:27 stop:197 length:171 start_codon:yes stop_codon:yes gene_type:complete